MQKPVNSFYAAKRSGSSQSPATQQYVKLPDAPQTGSPVPHLTSLYHFDSREPYGDRQYDGNCGGALIRDLLLFFRPTKVFERQPALAEIGRQSPWPTVTMLK